MIYCLIYPQVPIEILYYEKGKDKYRVRNRRSTETGSAAACNRSAEWLTQHGYEEELKIFLQKRKVLIFYPVITGCHVLPRCHGFQIELPFKRVLTYICVYFNQPKNQNQDQELGVEVEETKTMKTKHIRIRMRIRPL